jgi:enoyl-CoA hydratase
VTWARRLAERTPPDTFRLTKTQLQAALRLDPDPRVLELWLRGVEDGRIERYMTGIGLRNPGLP